MYMSSFLSKNKLPLIAGILMLVIIPIAVAVSGQVTNLTPRAAVEKTEQSKLTFTTDTKPTVGQDFDIAVYLDTTKDPKFVISGVDAIITYDPKYLEISAIALGSTLDTITQQNIDAAQGEITISLSNNTVQDQNGNPVGFSGDGKVAILKAKALKTGKTSLKYVYEKAASTSDTNVIGFLKNKPLEGQTPRERLLTEPSTLKLYVTNEQKNKISWSTPYVSLDADDFYITANGQRFTASDSKISIHSDPGNPQYTTLETVWDENNQEMRLFIYFRSDGSKWWAYEVRSYGGPEPGKWVYHHDANNPGEKIFTNSLGQPAIHSVSHLTPTGESQNLSPQNYNIHFENLKLQPFLSRVSPIPTPRASCAPRPTCLDANPACLLAPAPGTIFCPSSPRPSPTPAPTPKPTISLQIQLDMPGRDNKTIPGTLYGLETSQVQGVTIAQGFESIGSAAPVEVQRNRSTGPVQTLTTFTTNTSGMANVEIPAKFQGKSMWLFVRTQSHLVRKTTAPVTLSNNTGVSCLPEQPCPLRPIAIQQVTFTNLIPGDIYIAPNQTEQDNIINTFDALELVKHLGKASTASSDGTTLPDAADLNGDGVVNTRDYFIIVGTTTQPGTLGQTGDPLPGTIQPSASKAPVTCPQVYDPVCCNGRTYSNQCEAGVAGAKLCKPGTCKSLPSPSPISWQKCIGNPGARILESYPRKCITPDGQSVTETITSTNTNTSTSTSNGCPTTSNPVCASDGQTYNNECLAQQKGLYWTRGTCGQVSPPSTQ